MKKTDIIIKIALALLFTAAVYLFWAVPYRAVLSYHEQFQLFLLDGDYLAEHITWPAGMVTYVAEFLVQFFNNYWIGAAVVSLTLLAIQLLTWRITCRYTQAWGLLRYVLAYVPAVAMWVLMGDVNYMYTYALALILALLAFWAYTTLGSSAAKLAALAVGIPLLYWVAGPIIYLFALLVCIDIVYSQGKPYLKGVSCVLVAAYALATVVCSASMVNYPLSQVLIGIGYYRLFGTVTAMMWAVPITELVIVAVGAMLRHEPSSKGAVYKFVPAIATVAIAVTTWIGIDKTYDSRIQELTDYDYLIRTGQWDKIIAMAERKMPNTPLSLCATNFALGMTDQLCTRAFELRQHGIEGLIPPFHRDANSSLVTAEIFYQLGMVNSAQRLTFEAMEAISNFNKSSRCIKRLAETNMIRGDYAVAEKYLKMLDKTLMYRKWAQRTRQLINTPGALDAHPFYGKLRRMQIDDDFMFSEIELDKILGQLYLTDHENILARQYLMLYPLLVRNLDKFMQYLQVVQGVLPYRPVVCQQGVVFAYVNAGIEIPQGLIDPSVMQQFTDFARIMTSQGKDSPALDKYRNTLWYYLVKE